MVATSAVAAAATGAVPIPFSDAAVLVPEQVAMLGGITAVFGIPLEKATITAIVSATIGTAGTTVLGKTIVANLVKFIPGAGSVVGGVISGTTAAALTAALGEAYIAIMIMLCKGELSVSDLSSEKGQNTLLPHWLASSITGVLNLTIQRERKLARSLITASWPNRYCRFRRISPSISA